MAPLLRNALPYIAVAAILCGASKVVAIECPTAQNAAQGFMLIRGFLNVTEVYRTGADETHIVIRVPQRPVIEETLYSGLIPTERVENGLRVTYAPKSDLLRIFPLKVGESHRLDFERRTPDGRRAATQVEYKVVGVDRTTITGCVYDVFKVERRESVGKRPLQFVSTEWYAPDIRMILGREYKRKKGNLEYSQFYKYDAIVSMKERKEK